MKTFMPVVLFAISAAFLIWLVAATFAAPDRSRLPPDMKYQAHDCGAAVDVKTGYPLVCCRVSVVRELGT